MRNEESQRFFFFLLFCLVSGVIKASEVSLRVKFSGWPELYRLTKLTTVYELKENKRPKIRKLEDIPYRRRFEILCLESQKYIFVVQ